MSSDILTHTVDVSGSNVNSAEEIDGIRSSIDVIPETQNFSDKYLASSKAQKNSDAALKDRLNEANECESHSEVNVTKGGVQADMLHSRLEASDESQPIKPGVVGSGDHGTEESTVKVNGEIDKSPESKKSLTENQATDNEAGTSQSTGPGADKTELGIPEKSSIEKTAEPSKESSISDELKVTSSDKSEATVIAPSPIKGILKKRRPSPPPEPEEEARAKRRVEQDQADGEDEQLKKRRSRRGEPSESFDSSDLVGRHSLRTRPNQPLPKSDTLKKDSERDKEKHRQKSPRREEDVGVSREKRTRSTSSATSGDSSDASDHRAARSKRSGANKNAEKTAKAMPSRTTSSSKHPVTPVHSGNKSKTPISSNKSKPKADVASRGPVRSSNQTSRSGGSKKSNSTKAFDSFEFDDTAETSAAALPPLKHVHVARGAFNELKYTKAEDEARSPKYVGLSKSVEERRSQVFKSPQSTPSLKFTSSSEIKSSADSSKKSKSSTLPRSTPSSATRRFSSDLSSSDKNSPTKLKKSPIKGSGDLFDSATEEEYVSGGSGRKSNQKRSGSSIKGTPALFSDVEQKICDDFDAEDFLDRSNGAKKPVTNRRKRPSSKKRDSDVDEALGDEDADDLRVVNVSGQSPRRAPTTAAKRNRDGEDRSVESPVRRRQRVSQPQSVTPKRKEPDIPKYSPDQQIICDFPLDHHLLPGARVLAKWLDNYYPGNVVLNLGFGRYKIKFLDGVYRDMPLPDIIPLSMLKPGNMLMISVIAEDDDDELQPVSILSTPSATNSQEWYDGLFEVHNTITSADEKIPWHKFIIDKDQSKAYISSLINIAAQDITADNISESRVRLNRGKRVEETEEVSVEQKQTPKAAPSNAIVVKTPKPRRPTPSKMKTPQRTPKPKPTTTEYVHAPSLAEEEEFEERIGIFADSKFVLTSANRMKAAKDSSDSTQEEKPLIPFNKKQVRQMIDEHGGQVIEDFGTLETTNDCFLIADQYYRTHKYLSALARAVPCISHVWVHDCVNANTKLPHKNYVLPAGQSLETDLIVEWHQECPRLLAGLNVYVYTQNRPTNPGALDFVQIWAPLVKCMGAKLLTDFPDVDATDSRVDILLTDVSCPDDVLSRAVELGANAVSSEWLIQAIITGSRPEPNAHPKYRYDYVEQNVVG